MEGIPRHPPGRMPALVQVSVAAGGRCTPCDAANWPAGTAGDVGIGIVQPIIHSQRASQTRISARETSATGLAASPILARHLSIIL